MKKPYQCITNRHKNFQGFYVYFTNDNLERIFSIVFSRFACILPMEYILIKENSMTKSTKFTALENYHIYSKHAPNLMTFLTCHRQSTTRKMSEYKLNYYSYDGY